MRNHVHWLLLLLLSETACGQLEKGHGLLTGNVNSSFDQYRFGGGTSKNSQIQTSAAVSYGSFKRNNILLGAEISLVGSQSKSITDRAYAFTNDSYNRSLTLAPFARYYWQYGKMLLYAGGGLTLTGTQNGFNFNNNPSKADTREFAAALEGQAGIIYPVSNRIGVEVYARSTVLPISISTAGIGLVLFTGIRNHLTNEDTLTEFSQLSRGKLLLSTGFSTMRTHQSSTEPQDSSLVTSEGLRVQTTASIGIGYFIRDRTQIGIYGNYTVSYSRASSQPAYYTSATSESSNYVSVTPYIRHYLGKKALTPYIGGSLSLQTTKANGPVIINYGARLSTGLAYLLGKRFIVEAELINFQGMYSNIAPVNNSAAYETNSRWNTSFFATLRPNFTLSYVFR